MATVDFDKFKRFRLWMTRDGYEGDSARFYKGAVDGLAWLLSELRAQYPGTDRTHEIEAEIRKFAEEVGIDFEDIERAVCYENVCAHGRQ